MSERVREIQNNSEVSVKYMQAWEERVIEQQEAREEGRIEGRIEGRMEAHLIQIRKKLMKGFDSRQIAEALELDKAEVEALIEEIRSDENVQEN